ncbi:MAG TPA: hypothetical protein VGB23_10155 [Nitrospirota bacterium]
MQSGGVRDAVAMGGTRTSKAGFAVLVALCALMIAAARPVVRGYPVGFVKDVDKAAGAVSVDIGARDGVLKGLTFSVVDKKGHQVALVTADEVYDDLFWSSPRKAPEISKVVPGMQARWVFTPETASLLAAKRKDTPDAYREFINAFPASSFIPELVRLLPEDMLSALDPEYYAAWKSYNKDSFLEYADRRPGTGLANAALAEVKSIDEYEAEQKKVREERAKRAAAYEEERKRQEQVQEKMRAREEMRRREEMHGKLVNNSSETVRFVFSPPSLLPSTAVQAGGEFELNHPSGSYEYKVYAVQQQDNLVPAVVGGDTAEPEPLAEGTVDIQFDFWQVTYP